MTLRSGRRQLSLVLFRKSGPVPTVGAGPDQAAHGVPKPLYLTPVSLAIWSSHVARSDFENLERSPLRHEQVFDHLSIG